jgi:hypothetical protein
MKQRNPGFLADDIIDHNSEVFDYIKELHEYLWRFVRSQIPSASGELEKYIDVAIEIAESKKELK